MKTINCINYYDKEEIKNLLGCSSGYLNNRLSKAKIRGCYIGRKMYYTMEQIEAVLKYNPQSHESESNSNL